MPRNIVSGLTKGPVPAQPLEPQFKNQILICVDCQEEFVFTAQAQKYFAGRGFLVPPKRCKSCYNEQRNKRQPETNTQPNVNPDS
ncbi:MAG: zinc-ribbon domain containing protein [Candidatus Liptonbacteria bacterium]|nr:zinc-ribbon domain containing protein [Candidatus Liptonbacteria bacterium]